MTGPLHEDLSNLEESFLRLETPTTPMHLGATVILDGSSLSRPDGGIDIDRIRRYVTSRLSLIPTYRRRLAHVPLEGRPVWVDDDGFDITEHVVQARLPLPGSDRQLRRCCAELLERPLDRARPLWEIWVIEGLSDGRCALLCKVHHCMVGRGAGLDIMAALFSAVPQGSFEESPAWIPRPAPAGSELLGDGLWRRIRRGVNVLRELPDVLQHPTDSGKVLGRWLGALLEMVSSAMQGGMRTLLNRPVGPYRRLDWLKIDLDEIREIRREMGGTLNDVILTAVHGAVRRFLVKRSGIPSEGEFRVAVPVSAFGLAEQAGRMDNHSWAWNVALPLHEAKPRRCHDIIRKQTLHLKDARQAEGRAVMTEGVEWAATRLLGLGAPSINHLRSNLSVANVAGPSSPRYLLEARVRDIFLQPPLFEYQGLAIALFSYAGSLYWGLNADWDLVPDLDCFTTDLKESIADLRRETSGLRAKRQVAKPAAVAGARPMNDEAFGLGVSNNGNGNGRRRVLPRVHGAVASA
jgi:diacylglycerol O-acyltransferase / wax synthase